MKHTRQFLVALALGAAAQASIADIVTTTGTTTSGPTFNRPLEDLSALSMIGTAVRYDAYSFRVGTSGEYSFLTTAQFDTFAFLYAPSLNAAAPLANSLIGNDDRVGLTTSGFAYGLTAGVDYTLITTAFENGDAGFYSSTIGGSGAITATAPVPPQADRPNLRTFTGDTSSGPSFNRPLEDLSALSVIGTAVRYDTFSFRVGTAGEYSFMTTAAFDAFSVLYAPSLNAATPLAGSLIGNDDLVGLTTTGFAYSLLAGVDYTLVTTAFENGNGGFFSSTIGGPGDILTPTAPVPEPETYALMALGLAALGVVSRRRRAQSTPA